MSEAKFNCFIQLAHRSPEFFFNFDEADTERELGFRRLSNNEVAYRESGIRNFVISKTDLGKGPRRREEQVGKTRKRTHRRQNDGCGEGGHKSLGYFFLPSTDRLVTIEIYKYNFFF